MTTASTEHPDSSTSIGPPTLSEIVGAITADIEHRLGPGDVASLRRLRPGNLYCAPFWRLVVRHLESTEGRSDGVIDSSEARWAVIISSIASMRGLLRRNARLGISLANAHVAETRMLRLLRAHGDGLFDAVRMSVHQLTSRSIPVDPVELSRLLLSDGRRDEQRVRRQIARDYYRFPPAVRQTGPNPTED